MATGKAMAPSGPRSWWKQTPLSFVGTPFSRKPRSASNSADRMPKLSRCSSRTRPPSTMAQETS